MTGRGHARVPLHRTLVAVGLALVLWAIYATLFAVDVTEYGVVTRFGRVVRVVDEPGLHVKVPFDRVVRVEKRLLYSTPPQAEYLTEDKKNVVVRSLAVWRIADAKRFLETLGTRANAELRLADVVLAEIGAVLGRFAFASLVSSDEKRSQFWAMVSDVRDGVQAFVRPAYGIEVIDIDVRQLYLPDANKQSVFARMKAERGRMAKQYRSEGERDASQMIAEAEREKTRILAEAYEEAARIKAAGEAEAMRTYARAFRRNEAFYKFLRTLQAYEKILDGSTTVFLPAGAEVFQIFGGGIADGRPEKRRPEPPPSPGTDGLAAETLSRWPFAPAAGADTGRGSPRRDGGAHASGGRGSTPWP